MSIIQTDYIMRMVQMMGELILAASKLKKAGALSEADQTLSDALLTAAPDHADLIDMVDEKTAVTLLGDQRLIEAYVELLLERAELKQLLGEDLLSSDLQKRGIRIFLEKFSRVGELSPRGHLLYGRITGLELALLLSESELRDWQAIVRITS